MKVWLLTATLNQVLSLVILKTVLRRNKKRINNNNSSSKPQQKSKQAAMNGALPTWGLPQGRNTNIHPFVCPAKGMKKSEAPPINKDSSPLSVLMFFTETFHLLVEQTNVYYQQHLDRQAEPSRRLPDITLPDMTFIALALQMGHELKDTLRDYWSRLTYTIRFTARL